MNKNQVEGRANEKNGNVKEAPGKVTGDKSAEHKGKVEEHGGKTGAVLADINGDAKKAEKSTRKETK